VAHQDDVGAGGLVPTLDGHIATAPKEEKPPTSLALFSFSL